MIIENFIPVIKKPWSWKVNENHNDGDKSQECRACKKRKATEEFYRAQWMNDPERATYRRTCRGCRGLQLQLPPDFQAIEAELVSPVAKDVSGLISPLSRQVLLDLTNDPSRLIREGIFDQLRLSSLSDYENLQPPSRRSPEFGPCKTRDREPYEPQMVDAVDRQRTEGLGQGGSPKLPPPSRAVVTSVFVKASGSEGHVIRATGEKYLPKLERSFSNRWPCRTTLSYLVGTDADGPSDTGLHNSTRSECSTRIPRRLRFKSLP